MGGATSMYLEIALYPIQVCVELPLLVLKCHCFFFFFFAISIDLYLLISSEMSLEVFN